MAGCRRLHMIASELSRLSLNLGQPPGSVEESEGATRATTSKGGAGAHHQGSGMDPLCSSRLLPFAGRSRAQASGGDRTKRPAPRGLTQAMDRRPFDHVPRRSCCREGSSPRGGSARSPLEYPWNSFRSQSMALGASRADPALVTCPGPKATLES